ncbi:alpha/beta hydrolase family esterase, partial [Nocardia nova]|uniref:alpha/beta hydrolase family esterase n=1 Tax=Nocardia nova TaxID=37330 RepID=UPI0025B21289
MSAELIPGELTHDGRRRSFHLRPPRDPDSPLIVALHGNIGPDAEGGGLLMHDWTRFADHAEEWGVGVVYPDGCHGSWADGRGVTAAEENGVDDVGFLRTLIDWCAEKFRTSSDRTLVAGISNGAFMSHRLALECSERVAVFAAVAGALPADLTAVRPTHAVSAMLINGDADPLVPLAGGHSRHRG